ncbi:hypothetical protein AVEN_143118-1 [Araneus ventricosus]|uniref:Uncharacterized protein n=1 Tax=Araneus ventricosus TaxID=182803 RepID=A0A4Y2KIU1_ARAVE|nr:hypothetical protein AVEN_143118-1 [Araneus ventricosus]
MKREGNAFGRVLPFHVRDCIIDPDATVESGNVLFLGCPEIFVDFNSTSSDGSENKYFIRYFFNVTNDRTVDKVRSVGDDTLQNDFIRFCILSGHMYKLYRESLMQICESAAVLEAYLLRTNTRTASTKESLQLECRSSGEDFKKFRERMAFLKFLR